MIPVNGIYILFQKNEVGHSEERIVGVGTHTGDKEFHSRLRQQFVNLRKDRAIFRKNIGRALLNRDRDSFLEYWELDLTSREAKERYSPLIDFDRQELIEEQVSEFIRDNFSFCAFEVNDKATRLEIKSKLIATVSWCKECGPSANWLGNDSPDPKIAKSGLWQVQQLYKTPFDAAGIERLSELIANSLEKERQIIYAL